jgi:hypothetical protein
LGQNDNSPRDVAARDKNRIPGEWFKYDVVLSFAREQRAEIEAVQSALGEAGVKILYEECERMKFVGKDLYKHLSAV